MAMLKQIICTDKAPAAIGPYSQGVMVNGFLFTAGQVALDPTTGQFVEGDITVQTRRVMDNLVAVLDAAGLSMSDVVQASVFLADLNDFGAFNEVYGSYFDKQPPARTTIEVARLPIGARLEVAMIAATPAG